MKPLQHAKISAHKHGGEWNDYIDLHEFFDQTKAHVPDMRHRAILHNAFGIYLCQQVFGIVRVNSAGREYSVRDIGEDHCLDDLGTIPTIHEVINCIDTSHLKWLGGLPRKKRVIKMKASNVDVVEATENVEKATLESVRQKIQEAKSKLEKPSHCTECGVLYPPGSHPALVSHNEDCPVLERAAEEGKKIAKEFVGAIPARPSRDMVIDGGGAFYRSRNRSRLID